jgi:hypothetical protein
MKHALKHRVQKVAHRSKPKSRLGTIGKAAAFLASPFPDVELLIASMANPESGIKFVLGIAKRAGKRISEVQSVLFDRVKWTADSAKAWLHEHGFTSSGKDEGATFWRFRQNDPKRYKEFRTVVPGTHAKAENPYGSKPWEQIGYSLGYTRGQQDFAGSRWSAIATDSKIRTDAEWHIDNQINLQKGYRESYRPHIISAFVRGYYDGYSRRNRKMKQRSEANPADTYRSDAYRAGRAALKYGASQHGTVNLTPSITDKVEWGHAWSDFMRGWRDEQRVKENPTAGEAHQIGSRVSFHDSRKGATSSGIVVSIGRSSKHPWKVLRVRTDDGQEVEVHPDRVTNPTPGESILAYDEHLVTTMDPAFQAASPTEQAAAMTVQDATENPVPIMGEVLETTHDAISNKTLVKIGTPEYTKWYWVSGTVSGPQALALLQERIRKDFEDVRANPAYSQIQGSDYSQAHRRSWIQEWYETASGDARKRTAQLRKLRYQVSASGMGSQITPVGSVKMTLVDIRPGTSGDEDLNDVPPPAGGVARMNPDWNIYAQKLPSGKYGIFDRRTKEKIREVKTKSAALQVVVSMRAKANPESAAADLYEEFHGQPPAETLEIVTEKSEHEWLTQLGQLVELKVETVTNLDATFRFGKEAPELCSSEDGRQLYIEGGDQEIDLKALKMDGEKWVKDSMTLGVLYELTYRTAKGFHKFKTTDYFHKLGEESGVQPYLLYDPRNRLLSISGGQYRTKPEGIVN